ncbi:hypothetical protein [Mesoterricola sediminis]|uniref:Uncharacterized protein n=1 Tax=Mesoterricola sediminis TaxID=2927980 RepID=A0AA48KBA2_9BACT|nr:hypothetical protein [Mesoterricola sediminis]BDU75591.1 hypothetical protein METESE_05490 [Mesoterricola sediminis]
MTPRPPDVPASPEPAPAEQGAPGSVKVQKRSAAPAVATREKICATCGKPFRLAPEEKFFNCPACHRKANPPRKPPRRSDAQILTQITCSACGTQEYVSFVPPDPAAALCAACFGRQRRELQAQKNHQFGR